ncbi:MAG: hypothetical protein A2096_09780 [Spirochaetes bacterium GWF1_41_5]|nr:MAG: hypothetical protein A2096_09780 [Spirochaetes bacterium GWF1_41_5]HBE01268.1 hypothetical protein [Spirochaetia bacterium]
MNKITIFFLSVFGLLISAPPVTELLNRMDQSQKLSSDITARMSFLQVKPQMGTNKYEMIYYRRDRDHAFLLLMLEPSSESGNGYLKTGDNFWMYRKNTRTFQHINRDENISGTDIKSGDLEERKYSELYEPAKDEKGSILPAEETMLGANKVYKFTITAKVKDVTYFKQEIWMETGNHLPLKIENYSRSGTHMMTQLYKDYMEIKGRFLPRTGYSIDRFEAGNKTVFNILQADTAAIADTVFTKAYLENISK